MRKRILALVTAACMLLSVVPAAAQTQTADAADVTAYASADTVCTVSFPADTTGYTLYDVDTEDSDALTEITDGTAYAVAGDDLTFSIVLDEDYASASDVWVYADNELLAADADGFYTIYDVTADMTVTICGIGTTAPAYYTVTLPTGENYEAYAVNAAEDETQVIEGGIYGIELVVDDAYSGDYTVYANDTAIEADADGIYWITDVREDTAVTVDGTFAAKACALTLSYDESLYSVTVDGASVSDGSEVGISYGDTASIAVTALSGSDIVVVQDNSSILTADSSGAYAVTVTEDTSIKITAYTCGVTLFSYTGDLYGTAWTITYDSGSGSTLVEGDTLKFHITLLEGYTQSPLSVWSRVNGSGGYLDAYDSEVTSDTAVYYYEITDIQYGSNEDVVTDIQLYVASANARYTTRTPIQPNTYTATYYMGEGSSTVYTTQEITYGETIIAPDDPTKDGYAFKAWKNAAGKTYNFSKTVTGDISLYASWTTACTVTFKLGNGEADIVKTVAKGSTVSKPSNPTRSGYIFQGWYTSSGEKFDFSTEITEDTVLTAKWKEGTSIASLTFSSVSDQVYTGKAITPSVTVKDGSTTLVAGTDYTITYSSNTKVGAATITIKGIGDYGGSKTITFNIIPKKTKITSAKSTKKGTVKLKWKKSSTVTNYVIYRATKKNGKYKKIATTKKTTYTDKTAKSGKKYYYKVVVVKKSGSIVYSSKKSAAKKVKVK